jgi:hypothetical protein
MGGGGKLGLGVEYFMEKQSNVYTMKFAGASWKALVLLKS